ncbi:MAG: N-acetylmuramoyl-L-alanine amidase [Pseudobdellovibrionaceae bacterium]
MFSRFLTIAAMMLSVLVLCGTVGSARAMQLQDIRYGPHPDKDRLVLDFDTQTNLSLSASGDKITLTMPGGVVPSDLSRYQNLGPIRNVTSERMNDGKWRLNMQLSSARTIAKTFWTQPSAGMPMRFVIDLNKGGDAPVQRGAPPGFLQAPSDMQSLDQMVRQASATSDAAVMPRESIYGGNAPYPLRKPLGGEMASVAPSASPAAAPTPAQPTQLSGWKPLIVIDAGHGGKDPGARAHDGTQEKHIVLSLAHELARELEATGRYRTHLTRSGDSFIKLRERVNIARREKGDLFISIHADSVSDPHTQGASVYTLSDKASDEQTARLAARENKADAIAGVDLSHEDKDVQNILIDLVTRDTTNQSKFFANLVVSGLENQRVATLQRPHRHAGFAVLKAPDIPAVLIESGFVSNPDEVRKLTSQSYREQFSRGLVSAVDTYFMRLAALRTQ